MAKILVNYPSRSRPHKFIKILRDYSSRLSGKNDVHFLIKIDKDDTSLNNNRIINFLKSLNVSYNLEILEDCQGKVDAINRSVSKYDFDIVITISDDMELLVDGWDEIIAKDFKQNYFQCLNYNVDPRLEEKGFESLIVLPILGKDLYKKFEYIYHPSYKSEYCDNEQTEVFASLGVVTNINHKIIIHKWDQNQDQLMLRNIGVGHQYDRENYEKRKNALDKNGLQKIISFSIYGQKEKYIHGLYKNCELLEDIYPGWKLKIYWGSDSFQNRIKNFEKFKNVEIEFVQNDFIPVPNYHGPGVFWRFLPIFSELNQIVIFRDADSRLLVREKKCVDEWIKSPYKFSIIRDHPNHLNPYFPIMAGMWGIKGFVSKNIKSSMEQYSKNYQYLSDQNFLRDYIWPLCKNNSLIHSIEFEGWFKNERDPNNFDFIGQSYSENDIPDVHPLR